MLSLQQGFRNFMLVLLLSISIHPFAFANTQNKALTNIAVLYPTVSQQYSHMFNQLIAGINSVPGYRFISYRVNQNTTEEDVKKWGHSLNIKGYIALGQTTYKLAENLAADVPIIGGGMVATPPNISGISLSGDPEAFFRHLQLIAPNIDRVFFVHSQKNNGWLTQRARKISKKYNIEFIPLVVENFKQASFQYKIVLKSVQKKTDAIWIPLDNVAPLNILLPEILQVAWDKQITVFSNNLLHVRRGALFALYPDSYKQGRRLVALLQRYLDRPNSPPYLYPTVDFKIGVNIKTATHLNMRYSREMIKKFDKVFPSYK